MDGYDQNTLYMCVKLSKNKKWYPKTNDKYIKLEDFSIPHVLI